METNICVVLVLSSFFSSSDQAYIIWLKQAAVLWTDPDSFENETNWLKKKKWIHIKEEKNPSIPLKNSS